MSGQTFLKNHMEEIVKNNLVSVMKSAGCCDCETCRLDVAAIALNSLKPAYVVTDEGHMFTKVNELAFQYNADVIAAVTRGAEIVKENPRH